MGRRFWAILVTLMGVGVGARPAASDPAPRAALPPYPLDGVSREVAKRGPLHCPDVELVDYRGEVIRWQVPGKIFSGLREHLVVFENVARDAGIEIYGRPPTRVVQLGTFNCRRMRDYAEWLSEHALGNAVDVAGFDFGPLPKKTALPAGVDRAFATGFEVRVGRHWGKRTGHAALHARFLETLVVRLIERERERKDAFHVLLGPGYPGHQDHLHLDMAPFRMVQIFVDGGSIEGRARTLAAQPGT